ncbi:MAG TPA: DUF4157 domain-containing protein [Pyrinomonadaceae bacterium]|nr:DUF4157 domain-containing protein [Pyrinomonadaceae bacterium]
MTPHQIEAEVDPNRGLTAKPPVPEIPSAGVGPGRDVSRPDLQSIFGNSLLAAAATSDAPPNDPSHTLSFQPGFGNGAVSQHLIQRKADGAHPEPSNGAPASNAVSPLAATPTETPGAAAPTNAPTTEPTRPLIVEDKMEAKPGQMKKTEFLSQLRTAVCSTAAEALAETPWSAPGCPLIDRWFAFYETQDSQHLERAIRKYAPETGAVTSASAFVPIITGRVRRSLRTFVTTGEVTGMPEGVPTVLPGAGMLGAIGGAVAGAASGVAKAASTLVSGVGSAVSAIGGLLFKARNGGAREAGDPEVIQTQLGDGHSLDGGVRSRMESAFGESFGDVQVHADANGAGLSQNLNARAFTVGQHIAFGAGEYQPGTLIGDALIAHELAHVMQQRGADSAAGVMPKGETDYGALEDDADQAAVGAVVSTRGGARKRSADIARNVLPNMKSGLRLQRCAPDLDLSKFAAAPNYETTVEELRVLYQRKDAIVRGEEALDKRTEVDSAIAEKINALRFLGIRTDENQIYEAVMKSGGSQEMRKVGGKIVRSPPGPAHIGDRLSFTLFQDYIPPGRNVKLKWEWTDKEGKYYWIALGTGFPQGETITLDDFFWNVVRPRGKFEVFVNIYLGDERLPAGQAFSGEIKLEEPEAGKFAIEPSTKVAIKGAQVEFKVKGWSVEWQKHSIEWQIDGLPVKGDYLVLQHSFETAGKHHVGAKLYSAKRGFWGTEKNLLQTSDPAEVDVQEPVVYGEAALSEAAKVRTPAGLAEYKQSIEESMPEVGRRAALGGEQQPYWTERFKAKEEQAKGIAEKVPFYKEAQPLPAQITELPDGKYTAPIPAVIVYPKGIQPITIYLSVEKYYGAAKAKLIDVTGKKVIEFVATGQTGFEAIAKAFEKWMAINPYPQGGSVVYTFKPHGWNLTNNFSTNRSDKEAEEWVDGILKVGGFILGALLLIVPEPTAVTKVAGYALMALSIARSATQIYKNLELGYGALDKENVIEGLSIVTAFMGASGSMMRAVGAEVRAVRPLVYRVGNILVMGSLAGDVGTLVYATEEALAALKAAEGDPTLSDAEKGEQAIRVISGLLASAALVFVSNKDLFKNIKSSDFIKQRLPASEKVEIGKATRLDLELEMRNAGADPIELRKLENRELLGAFLTMQRRQTATKRLTELRNGLSDAAIKEFDALRAQHDSPESFAAEIEKLSNPQGHFEDLAVKKQAGTKGPVVVSPTKPVPQLAAAIHRLDKLDPASRIEIAPDSPLSSTPGGTVYAAPESQIRINGQIDIHPAKLKEMSDAEVAAMLKATRLLNQHGGDLTKLKTGKTAELVESTNALKSLSTSEGHRLRFEYQRMEADALLEKLGLKDEPIFKDMTDAERNRVYDGVVKESISKSALHLQAQAANYAMSQKPASAREFVGHYQYYARQFEELSSRASANYTHRVNEVYAEKVAAWEKANTEVLDIKTKERLRSEAEAKVRIEKGVTGKLKEFFATQTEKEMAAGPDKLDMPGEAVTKSIAGKYEMLAKETRGRTGVARIPAGLPPHQIIEQVQALKEIPLGTEFDAVYHTAKHLEIIPSQERTGRPFDDYMGSVVKTIRSADPASVSIKATQDGNAQSFTFSRSVTDEQSGKVRIVKAIVIVTNDGRVILATYM